MDKQYDFLIIGSGFGGAVAAMRLAEKGYSVCVLEAGKRWNPKDFPKSNWNVRKFLWAPPIGCHGIQRIWLLDDIMGLGGAGVGGGSLVYANVLMTPLDPFFKDPQWNEMDDDWKKTLEPYFAEVRRMLGVAKTPKEFPADKLLQDYAAKLGREEHYNPTEVGVFFGEPNVTVPDPYFGGEGPERTGCDFSGACMVGCRTGGKNTLDKNYLWFAEKKGAVIVPEIKAWSIEADPEGGYLVHTHKATSFFKGNRKTWRCKQLVVAAGTLGTLDLLLRCKTKGTLPNLSDTLGNKFRTNCEALTGSRSNKKTNNFSEGVAITSILQVNDATSIEPVRYPEGSDVMGALAQVLTDGGTRFTRPLKWFWRCITHPTHFFKSAWIFGWAKRTVILLVMQVWDHSLKVLLKRSWLPPFRLRLATKTGDKRIPTYMPEANAAARYMADRVEGIPQGAVSEVMLDRPLTAHLMGGCCIGPDAEKGVVDKYGRAYGYEGLYIVDGSIMPANLGVNPSLTIAALAEHCMSNVPEKKSE